MARESEGFHYEFIHNVFGHFMENTLEYFGDYLYPRFEHQVVATYSKAVEYFTKGDLYNREHDKPNLPALILNPSGEFNLDDANSAGAKQLWRFPNLAPGMISTFYEPIYQDNNNIVTVGHTRLKGEIELLMLLNSFYEYCDVKILLIQMFGGEGRPIEPVNFNSFIIIPPDLYNFEYSNEVTGLTYTLDWDNSGAEEVLVKTTNKDEIVVNGKIKPRYILRGMSDNSSRYGGVDDLAEWKLTAQIEYEIEMPSFIMLETDYVVENLKFELRAETAYSTYPDYAIPGTRSIIETHWDSGMEETEDSRPDLPEESEITGRYDLIYKTRYFHVIDQTDMDATSYIEITIPELITEYDKIIVNSKDGPLTQFDHYTIHNSETVVKIDKEYVFLDLGDVVEAHVYKGSFQASIPVPILGASSMSTSARGVMDQGRAEDLAGTVNISSDASLLIVELVTGTVHVLSAGLSDLEVTGGSYNYVEDFPLDHYHDAGYILNDVDLNTGNSQGRIGYKDEDGGGVYHEFMLIEFNGFYLLPDIVINSAILSVYTGYYTYPSKPSPYKVYISDETHPTLPSRASSYNERTWIEVANFDHPEEWLSNEWKASSDMTAGIIALMSQPSWDSSSSILFSIKTIGGPTLGTDTYRRFVMPGPEVPIEMPKFTIDFTVPYDISGPPPGP